MPTPNVGQRVAANWEKVVGSGPEDNIHDDYWLLNQLSKGDGFMAVNGGDFLAYPIEYALNTTVSSYSDTDTFSTARNDNFDRGKSEWKEIIGSAVISQIEKDRNKGEGEVFALLPAKLENLKNSCREYLNRAMHGDGTGNSSKDPAGLALWVASSPSTGSPGDINRANFTFWRNQQTSGAKTTSAYDNLRAAMRSVYNQCSNGVADAHPSFAVTTRTVFEAYEGLLLANERFTSKDDGDGGFKNEVLKFKGAKISYDNDATAAELRFLNPKFLKLAYMKGWWMKMLEPIRPSNQTIEVYSARTVCNTFSPQPRRLGVVTAID